MTDPEARLAAALEYARRDERARLLRDAESENFVYLVNDEGTLMASVAAFFAEHDDEASDPTLICPDPAAHEGVTFTVDSLAAALTAVSGKRPHPEFVAEVIQAAKVCRDPLCDSKHREDEPCYRKPAKEAEQNHCRNCGQPLTAWACGPTHASVRNERGLEWDGIEPGAAKEAGTVQTPARDRIGVEPSKAIKHEWEPEEESFTVVFYRGPVRFLGTGHSLEAAYTAAKKEAERE